jgi:hypothetical protein
MFRNGRKDIRFVVDACDFRVDTGSSPLTLKWREFCSVILSEYLLDFGVGVVKGTININTIRTANSAYH